MDFSKFRASGDLSDITVFVDGQDNKLHKFPLYARSDYFCELTRSHPSGESEVSHVELKDFPGGNEIFEQVADFCYNMPVNITKNNAVAIRCAAEYLKMNGTGNLMEVTDTFISDSISTSRLNNSTAGPVAMLMDCNAFGDIAKSAGIVALCIDALIDCWTKPSTKFNPFGTSGVFSKVPLRSKINDVGVSSAFTKVQHPSANHQGATEKLDEVSINCLISIRPDWFASFLSTARDQGVAMPDLGHLAVRYVSSAIDRDTSNNGTSAISPAEATADASQNANRSEKEADETDVTDNATSSSQQSLHNSDPQIDLGSILDQVILVLPEKAYSIPAVTMEWLTKVLRIATTRASKCRCHLVRIAGEMLTHLGPEELCVISPSVLHDIVVDAAAEDSSDPSVTANKPSIHSERACKLVDTYLGQMSTKGVLTSETFRLLVSATKNYPRTSHDPLYSILESVLKTEKDKLSSSQRMELVELVNFDLLSEPNLQRALDEDVAPPATIASSSLKLCSKLRSELASVKYIAEMQEEDIQKYQTVAAANVATSLHSKSPALSSEPRRFTSLSARDRNIDSGFADILEPLPKSPSDHELAADVEKADPMRAAQNLLTAARHKLAVPMYTGYRPALLTRLSSPSNVTSHSHQTSRGTVEHDISLEEELEFKFDRTFRSLDPRVRQQRLNLRGDNAHHNHHTSSHSHHSGPQRSYFPYSSGSYRY